MGENYHPSSTEIFIGIYLLEKNDLDGIFNIKGELQSFGFSNYQQAKRFLENIPSLSAIELLILMNQDLLGSQDSGYSFTLSH